MEAEAETVGEVGREGGWDGERKIPCRASAALNDPGGLCGLAYFYEKVRASVCAMISRVKASCCFRQWIEFRRETNPDLHRQI